jgi:hypothetical protein
LKHHWIEEMPMPRYRRAYAADVSPAVERVNRLREIRNRSEGEIAAIGIPPFVPTVPELVLLHGFRQLPPPLQETVCHLVTSMIATLPQPTDGTDQQMIPCFTEALARLSASSLEPTLVQMFRSHQTRREREAAEA